MKRFSLIVFSLLLFAVSCSRAPEADGRLKVTCTNFPAYDAARAVFSDRADIRMILPYGGESHSYEPTGDDVVRIIESDLFIHSGGESEYFAQRIIDSLDSDVRTFALTDNVSVLFTESDEGIIQKEEEEEGEVVDEHVWTGISNEIDIINNLCRTACEMDEEGAEYYRANAASYVKQLEELRSEFDETVRTAKRRTLVVTDRFPLLYFTEEFGLDYIAAYPGCAAETEVSASTVARIIDYVRENDIPVVLHMELANTLLSETVADETGCRVLEFSACHNVSRREGLAGVTYIDLMKRNVEVLKEALN